MQTPGGGPLLFMPSPHEREFRSHSKERTPNSSRRSLTPTRGEDVAPMPPTRSLFDTSDAGAARGGTAGAREMPLADYVEADGDWVTVYGFSQDDVPLVLQEFAKCGHILRFGTFGSGPHVNWLHLRYETRHGAQRALARSGEQLSATLIVGVKPISSTHKRAISEHDPDGGAPAPPPRAQPVRPYRVDMARAKMLPIPRQNPTLFSKLSEVIFGQ